MKEYKRIVVFGDIHGRSVWKDIVEAENPDLTIFLGDYVTSREFIPEDEQLRNLDEILRYKEENPDTVVMLRGNHDCEAAGFSWGGCYPSFDNKDDFPLEKYERLTQWVYQWKNIVFSHAGISRTFLALQDLTIEDLTKLRPFDDDRFRFTPSSMSDYCGDSVTQTPVWIRPQALLSDMPDGLTQVVGHTTLRSIAKADDDRGNSLWLCDALGNKNYLCIEDGVITAKVFK